MVAVGLWRGRSAFGCALCPNGIHQGAEGSPVQHRNTGHSGGAGRDSHRRRGRSRCRGGSVLAGRTAGGFCSCPRAFGIERTGQAVAIASRHRGRWRATHCGCHDAQHRCNHAGLGGRSDRRRWPHHQWQFRARRSSDHGRITSRGKDGWCRCLCRIDQRRWHVEDRSDKGRIEQRGRQDW